MLFYYCFGTLEKLQLNPDNVESKGISFLWEIGKKTVGKEKEIDKGAKTDRKMLCFHIINSIFYETQSKETYKYRGTNTDIKMLYFYIAPLVLDRHSNVINSISFSLRQRAIGNEAIESIASLFL